MAGSLKFVVEVNADQATQGFRAISSGLDELGIKSRVSFLAVAGGARGAGDEASGLQSRIKELKSEMASGDRTINFFARSLNGIVPEATVAGQAIRLISDGLIGGIGLGFAIQGVMSLLTLFGEHLKATSEAEKKAAEESKKAAADRLKAYQDADREFRKLKFIQAGGTAEGFAASEADKAAGGRLETARAGLAAARNRFDVNWRGNVPDEGTMHWEQYRAELEEIARLQAEVVQAERAAGQTVAVGAAATDKSFDDSPRKKAEADALKFYQEETKRMVDKAKLADELAIQEANARGEVDNFIAASQKRQEEKAEKLKEFWRQFNAEVEEAERQIRQKEQAEMQKRAEQYATFGQRVGEAFGSALAQGMSPLKAITVLLKEVAKEMLQLAIKSITMSAGKAAGEAAASQAGTPVVGPALAAGAMSAMLAMVMGLIGTLPSAAGGMKVPSDMLALIHKDERVLPARYSAGLDRLVNRGGGGSGDTYMITAMDGASVRRVVDSPDYQRAKRRSDRQARRRGATV